MANIETIKKQGAIGALQTSIRNLQNDLERIWEDTESNGRFIRLGSAIVAAQHKLTEMRTLLQAITELDDKQR